MALPTKIDLEHAITELEVELALKIETVNNVYVDLALTEQRIKDLQDYLSRLKQAKATLEGIPENDFPIPVVV